MSKRFACRCAHPKLLDFYSLVDTGPHKWRAKPVVPAICDFREAAIGFNIASSAPYPFRLNGDFLSANVIYVTAGNALGTPFHSAIQRWNKGEYPLEAGEHNDLPLFSTLEVHTDNGYGRRIPFSLSVNLAVQKHLYFGHFPIIKMSGFKDEIKGGVITNAFDIGMLDPETITRKWTKIDAEDMAPIKLVLRMVGLYGWPEGSE